MIECIELKNVRVFDDKPWRFDLRPLTVLCGSNSVGKSTLLKTLLLLQQTNDSREPGKLRLAGPKVDFGDYRSFVSHNEAGRTVSIGIGVRVSLEQTRIEALLQGKRRGSKTRTKKRSDVVSDCLFESSFEFGIGADDRQQELPLDLPPPAHRDHTPHVSLRGDLKRAEFELRSGGRKLIQWSIVPSEDPGGYSLRIPRAYLEKAGWLQMMEAQTVDDDILSRAVMQGLLLQGIFAKVASDKQRPDDETRWSYWPLPPEIFAANRAFGEALDMVQYLGPLRSPAKRFYLAQFEPDSESDPRGELLPYLLRDKGSDKVPNCSPGISSDMRLQPLREALDEWVCYIRTGDPTGRFSLQREVSIETTKNVLVQINLHSASAGESHALADSGFGYSQVLPILVWGLLAPEGTTLMVEQPELHLNPSLQVRLAEFFVAMIRVGKQILVETHSEHLVNAIRVLTAEDSTGELASNSLIYYLDLDEHGPTVHELSIQPDGTVPDWPRHFFGEALSLSTRLLKAQRQYRNQKGVK